MIKLEALILILPARHSTVRILVWRALKDTGCGVLRDGVYVLPKAAAGSAVLAKMESEIDAAGGSAMTVELTLRSAEQRRRVLKLFDRGADYGRLVRKIEQAKAALPRQGGGRAKASLRTLERAYERLARIDFFPARAKRQAAEAIAALKQKHGEVHAGGEPLPSGRRLRQLDRATYQRRVWATRRDPWVDRLASAWLIRRFIDREARFAWLEHPRDLPKKAVGFDFDGAQFTHIGKRVTFEVLLASFGLDRDPALVTIGAAVHFLDVGGIPVPDAKGLETLLRGAKGKAKSDDARLIEAMRVLDLLYSAYSPASQPV